ncbi:L,D-transpeptidase [Streptomyces sp. NPDC086549]|uniref:L,D-transpeptidase n=1 Tax=Streptomyces sp. NPDC086549 TaxID=3365752 RepID=UPI00382A4CA8
MSDELSSALREFAAEHETPAVVGGAEIRRRAVRRARRRVAGMLGAGAAALALVAFAWNLDLAGDGKQRQVPAAPPAVSAHPSPSPSPTTSAVPSPTATPVLVVGTIDRGRRTLTVGGKVMPMGSGFDKNPTLRGPMTVYKKPGKTTLTVTNQTNGTRYNAVISYAVELRDAGNEPVYVGTAFAYNVKGIGKYDTSGGWIALDQADAKWFYDDVKTGGVLSVTGTAS